MRILMVNDHWSPAGGKEVYIAELRAALESEGHTTAVLHEERTSATLDVDQTVHFSVPELGQTLSATAVRRCVEVIELFKPDVLHIHHNVRNLRALFRMTRLIPTLRSVHDVEILCPARYYMRPDGSSCGIRFGSGCFAAGCLQVTSMSSWRRLARTALNRDAWRPPVRIHTLSRFMQRGLERLGFREVTVLPFYARWPEAAPEQPRQTFLVVGRLNPMKGPQLAIEAMKQVPGDTRLKIAGEGAMRSDLESAVRSAGLGNRVELTGHLSGPSLEEAYAGAIAVILPSLMPENCPVVVLEAMARGIPVIATDLGGTGELVDDGVSGFLIPPDNASVLADRIRRLDQDRQLARKIGAAGQQILREPRFARQLHVDGMVRLYEATRREFWETGVA